MALRGLERERDGTWFLPAVGRDLTRPLGRSSALRIPGVERPLRLSPNRMSTLSRGLVANLRYDLPASIVVFLVAVPLCLGIALASGAPLFAGIIAGIVGGIVVGALSGSPLGVSGPAAGLAVIVLTAIEDLGAFEIFLAAVVLSGLIQIALGFLKAGVIGYYFPTSVIKGMLAGIGVIIVLKQIPHAFGYDADPEGSLTFQQPDGQNTFSELVNMFNFVSPAAVIVTLVALGILIVWARPGVANHKVLGLVPGPLLAVGVSIALALAFAGGGLAFRPDQLVQIPVAGSLSEVAGLFTLPEFSAMARPEVWVVAATIAVVGSLETLLCVEATDKLDPFKRVTPTNRELKAQGVGNAISGLVGGLPITQVIVRSSANIQAGGRTKGSAIAHGVLLLVCALAIPTLLNLIPLAALAAILFVVGYKLARPAVVKQMWAGGWTQFVPFIVTVLGIVFTDLLVGILMGLSVAVVIILFQAWRTPFSLDDDGHEPGHPVRMELPQHVAFFNKASIQHTLNDVPDGAHVIIDARLAQYVDPDVVETIRDFQTNAETRDIEVEVLGEIGGRAPDPIDRLHTTARDRLTASAERRRPGDGQGGPVPELAPPASA